MKTASTIVANYLIGVASFSTPGGVGTWPLYKNSMPEVTVNCGCLYDTTPVGEGKTMAGSYTQHYGLQLGVRATVCDDGYEKLDTVATALDLVHNATVAIGGDTYTILSFTRATSIILLEQDEKRRYIHELNLVVSIRKES